MKNRKRNRMIGFDYSADNLYFITNCVKDNRCCFGRVVSVGTGRDLSVPNSLFIPNSLSVPNSSSVSNAQNILNNSNLENPTIEYQMQLNVYGSIVEERINWLALQYSYVVIHNYVVMPNHFHFILEIDSKRVDHPETKIKSVSELMGALKTTSSKLLRQAGLDDFSWHRSFYDNIIRNGAAYHHISQYIDMNPQKWHQDRFFSF